MNDQNSNDPLYTAMLDDGIILPAPQAHCGVEGCHHTKESGYSYCLDHNFEFGIDLEPR